MTDDTRAAASRVRAFADALHPRVDTILTLTPLEPTGERIPLRASDLRTLLAAIDEHAGLRNRVTAAAAYCALWDAHGLVLGALDPADQPTAHKDSQ